MQSLLSKINFTINLRYTQTELALPDAVETVSGGTGVRSEPRELQSRPSGCNCELRSEIETNWIIYTINNLIETFENSLFKQAF